MRAALALAAFALLGTALYLAFANRGAPPGLPSGESAPAGRPVLAPATMSATSALPATDVSIRPYEADELPPSPPAPPQAKDVAAAIKEASRALPTVAQLRALSPEEVHHTPEPVRKAIGLIGQVAAAIEREPSRAGEGLAFYGDCARRKQVAVSVKALCLTRMRELSRSTGLPASEDGIAGDVKQISDFTTN